MKNLFYATAIAAVLGTATLAQAAPLTVLEFGNNGVEQAHPETQVSGLPGYVPTSDPGDADSRDGFSNGNVRFDMLGTYQLEYWGSGNASYINRFYVLPESGYSFVSDPNNTDPNPLNAGRSIAIVQQGGLPIPNPSVPIFVTVDTVGAILKFAFDTDRGTGVVGTCRVASAEAKRDDKCNYLAGVDGVVLPAGSSASGTVAYLGYDDTNEFGDLDHQDLVIKISKVPEPGSLALLGAALAGLLMVQRRRPQA